MARTVLLYGESGSYKTSNLGQIVDYLYERFGCPVRGVFADNRGPLQTQVNAGRLIPWDIVTHSDPLGCLIAASKGYWPVSLTDGVATGPLRLTTADEFQGLSGYLCEGLTENAAIIMRDREDKGISTGQPLILDHNELIAGSPGLNIHFAMASQGTYGFAQLQTHRYVKTGFQRLNVPWFIATAHQLNDLDKRNNRVCGPAVAGKAMTNHVAQWFDLTIHLDKYFFDHVPVLADGKKGKPVKRQGSRAFYTSHADQHNPSAIWPAKLGVPPELQAEIFKLWPEGFVPLVLGADGVYQSSVRNLLELIDMRSDEQLEGV